MVIMTRRLPGEMAPSFQPSGARRPRKRGVEPDHDRAPTTIAEAESDIQEQALLARAGRAKADGADVSEVSVPPATRRPGSQRPNSVASRPSRARPHGGGSARRRRAP
jgi:hypothetical protein